MSNLVSLVKRAPRRFSALLAIVVAAIVVPASLNAWGPTRELFTIEKPASYVTFNSITNNPNIGDERNFVGIRESGTTNLWKDEMSVQNDKEYTVRMYVHNNAAANLNLVAENVTAKFNLPTTTGKEVQVNGFLSASNSKPGEVYDHAKFVSDRNFNVALVPGSIIYENNKGTHKLSESILTSTGVKLGYEKMDGKIPGCFEYAGYVSFKVKAQVQQVTNFTLDKKVSKHGENKWVENYKAQPGEVVDFVLQYKNTGEVQHDSVTFRDTLPAGLSYVANSTKWGNARGTYNVTTNDGNLTNGTGINIGSYKPGAAAWAIFSAKVADESKLKCGTNTLRNVGKVNTGGYAVENDATVTVDKTCQPPAAKYICKSLGITQVDRTHFKFTTSYSATNATFSRVTYVIKNASGQVVDTKTSTETTLNYTQTTAGNFTVQSTLYFQVNGQEKSVTSEYCKGSFTVKELPKKITVCELSTKKIITIYEKDFDASKHSKNLDDCKEVPPVKIEVCELATKTIVTINESDFDASKHSKDLSKCEETPVTPPELPQTGTGENIVAILGLGALIASIGYYAASRRALNQ